LTADTAHDPKRSTTYRVMLAVVIILGVLILIAFGALIVGAAMKIAGHSTRAPAAPAFAPAQASAELPPGARITSVSTTGNRVVIGVHTPQGDEVDIFDTDSGRPIARIRPAPQAAK
jgi:hypothetical protein